MTKVTKKAGDRLNNDKNVTIVDSRSDEAWSESQAKAGGTVRVPPGEAEKHIADINWDDYVVTCRTGPSGASGTRAAQLLEENGITDVHPLIGGFDAWQDANLPVGPKQLLSRQS